MSFLTSPFFIFALNQQEGAGTFKTLVAAVNAADLGSTLTGPGPFTVFAPSDEAFAKLPEGTVDGLLKDIPKLKSILTYHVVSGKVPASEVTTMDGKKAATVNGAEVAVKVDPNGVMVNGAKVTQTDIMCDNGIIHTIDQCLMYGYKQMNAETGLGGMK